MPAKLKRTKTAKRTAKTKITKRVTAAAKKTKKVAKPKKATVAKKVKKVTKPKKATVAKKAKKVTKPKKATVAKKAKKVTKPKKATAAKKAKKVTKPKTAKKIVKKTVKSKKVKKVTPIKKAKKIAKPKKATSVKKIKKDKSMVKPKKIKQVKQPAKSKVAAAPFINTTQWLSDIAPYTPKKTEKYMSAKMVEHFRKILTVWRLQLMEEVDRTVHHMQDEAANFPDPSDRATQEEEFNLELRTRDRERKLIKKIDEALRMIDEGVYGYCEACGDEIGLRRLEARPTAVLCIDCKTLDEIREKQQGG